MESNTVSIKKLQEALGLIQISGNEESLQRWIISQAVNRPGLELSGFVDFEEKKRVTIIGNKELHYIETLDDSVLPKRFDELTDAYTPCVIISSSRECPSLLLNIARSKNFPVFSTSDRSSELMVKIIGFLENELAPTTQVHGTLLSIYGRGIMVTGESGIGKSETALELIKKGHILVADDAVVLRRIQNRLIGQAPAVLEGMIEIRGIGIVDVNRMFGASSFVRNIKLDHIVHLEDWNKNTNYKRIPLGEEQKKEILGIEVSTITIPVREGRSMSEIIETAVIHYNLKLDGYDSNQEFDRKVIENIQGKNDG